MLVVETVLRRPVERGTTGAQVLGLVVAGQLVPPAGAGVQEAGDQGEHARAVRATMHQVTQLHDLQVLRQRPGGRVGAQVGQGGLQLGQVSADVADDRGAGHDQHHDSVEKSMDRAASSSSVMCSTARSGPGAVHR